MSFVVGDDDAGLRLDQVLARRIAGLSRRKARVAIDIGGVFVDRARVKVAGRTVCVGQMIEVNLGGALDRATGDVGADARARDNAALPSYSILFEDDHVIVVDKPAGLVTAPTPESDRGNLADLLSRRVGASPVHVVHRLDRPTSGVLVFAKTDVANRELSAAFASHTVEREYRAVAIGAITQAATIDRAIDGRRAVTHVVPIEAVPGATITSCRLETGRSHQIRIHLAAIERPIAGDRHHGGSMARDFRPPPPRLALHALVLGFRHPTTGESLRFERPIPADLESWIATLHANAM